MESAILSESDFRRFRELIYAKAGIALADVKLHLMQSRLQRRLRHHHLSSFGEYYSLLTESPASDDETRAFINCVTTNTTSFFREPHHFDFVSKKILPEMDELARMRAIEPRLRIWHAGCSTGEEPYSLAITLRNALARLHCDWNVLQLATDIDTDVLAHAERGVYEEDRIERVPGDLRRSSFLRGKGANNHLYKIKREFRDQIVFRQINLLEAWPFRESTRFDMIWCRNVIIYFDRPTQKRLFARFAGLIKPGGYLFIGHSESLLGITDAFEPAGQTIYRKPPDCAARGMRAA
jgi:chemotaxis protein methyltransferase CheR